MEYIESIYYRKVNPSDFKKLYDLDKPATGGGQTYLETAGVDNNKLINFLSIGEISDSKLTDETRNIYTINVYVLGEDGDYEKMEFAPRGGRNNYRISRQNMSSKHSAWSSSNGFPEPEINEQNEYQSHHNFDGIIDNLVIYIIKTTYNRYFASFINTARIPENWPENIGLESLFTADRRGILMLTSYKIPFINDKDTPFGSPEVPNLEEVRRPGGSNVLLYGVPGAGKSWTIERDYCQDEDRMERLVFHPDYTYSDFVGQILPSVSEDIVRYDFTPGPFTTMLKKAYMNPSKEYFLIIEEINRGNSPAIFGEVFQLLDRKSTVREVNDDGFAIGTSEYGISNADIAKVVYDDPSHKIRIPSNLSIIGTMNTSDQNVFTLDTAFQRRWNMRMIENNFDNVEENFSKQAILDTDTTWERFCTEINNIILDKNVRMTSSEDKRLGIYFVQLNDLTYDENEENLALTDVELKKAKRNNSRFPEKVLKYLWDDAFKFSRGDIFEINQYNSLESIVKEFTNEKGNNRFKIFKENIYDAIVPSEENTEGN